MGASEFWDLARAAPGVFTAGMAAAGACVASFSNVVAARLPARLERGWEDAAREQLGMAPSADPEPPGLAGPASRCPKCGRGIRPWENVPILGWIGLKGRCAGCKGGISPRYPIVEAAGALIGAGSALAFGAGPSAVAAACLGLALLTAALVDADTMLLPDCITLPLLWAGLAASAMGAGFVGPKAAILGAAAGYGALWGVFHLFRLLTGKEGFGRGDFKLLAAIGAWMGPGAILPVFLMSGILGGIFGAIAARNGRPFPFGPAIAAASGIALFFPGAVSAAMAMLARLG